ncbi:MAG: peroxiredoxin family protein [Halodesulfurarchaeum sp.]
MTDSETPPAPDFELSNVGAGSSPVSLSELASDPGIRGVLLLFQRDLHCTNCRAQVQDVAERYAEFQELGVEVLSVLPEAADRAREWQDRYELPYPLLADPDASVGEAYDQPVRFGVLGSLSDFLGRMPEAVVVDLRTDPRIVAAHRGRSTWDRPDVDGLLALVRDGLDGSPDRD